MSLRISFDDFQTGNFSVAAFVRIFYSDDGVDVGVGLLNDFWQVMDFNGRIMEINLKIMIKGSISKAKLLRKVGAMHGTTSSDSPRLSLLFKIGNY